MVPSKAHLKARSHPKTRQVLDAHENITRALEALSEDNVEKAYKLGNLALKSPARNSSRARLLMYQVRKYQGKDDLALLNLERISNWELAPVNAYDSIIDEYLRKGRYDKAETYLNKGQSIYEREPFFPQEIVLSKSKNDPESALAVYNECQATKNKTIKHACSQVIGSLVQQNKSNSPVPNELLPAALENLDPLKGFFQ